MDTHLLYADVQAFLAIGRVARYPTRLARRRVSSYAIIAMT
jgi:hypothetical protein